MGYVGSVERLCRELCFNKKNREKGESYEDCIVRCVKIMLGNT